MVFLGVVLLVGAAAGYMGLRAYLHSEGFRKFLSAEVSRAAKVEGQFSEFRWDGLAVETEKFEATGEGMIAAIKAENIGTEVGFGGLGRGVWEVKSTRISRIEVGLDFTKKSEPSPTLPEKIEKAVEKKQPGWVPSEIELDSLQIGEVAVKAKTFEGTVASRGMKVLVKPSQGKGAYEAEITGGTIDPAKDWLPVIRLDRIVGTYRDGSAFITKADLEAWGEGRIHGFGEWSSETGTYSFEGGVEGVKCDEILSENWARRMTGDVSSTFAVNNIRGSMVMDGELTIRNGTLTALPMLEALAAYADTRRFRVLQLSEAHTKWRYSDGEFLFTDLVMGSEGLIRIEGNISIKGEAIDGRFNLGLVPGTLSRIPGAETDVFKPGEHGLLWAPLHLTGTLDDPKEDLTNRLIDAAGKRMFEQIPETGEQVFKFTKSVLGESPVDAIGKGFDIIDQGGEVIKEGEKVIKDAEGIFRGLLGD
jgi:hypothetical protein